MMIEFVVHVPEHAAGRFRQACKSHSRWTVVSERPVEESFYDAETTAPLNPILVFPDEIEGDEA